MVGTKQRGINMNIKCNSGCKNVNCGMCTLENPILDLEPSISDANSLDCKCSSFEIKTKPKRLKVLWPGIFAAWENFSKVYHKEPYEPYTVFVAQKHLENALCEINELDLKERHSKMIGVKTTGY